ncbi:hypothetical protein NQ176_g7947 [Zarea fungicola]|uniref:Uncharacterized protein n=1 Tax=Zarea fungicola TaxID=93591 RepID=A0ACC1MXF7_9HYPO|nr:hypothetical protein NQ176_g7947 [Lecanicillium fungicola]
MVSILRVLFLAMAVTASPLVERDVATVKNDITQKIGPQLRKLNNDVNGFPESGLVGALAIHSDSVTLVQTLNAATANVKSTGSFDVVAGSTVLTLIQALFPELHATLVSISGKVEYFEAVQGGKNLVFADLKAQNATFSNYLDAIAAAEPDLLKSGATGIKTLINATYATIISYYSAD